MDIYALLLEHIKSCDNIRIELDHMITHLRQKDDRFRRRIDQPEGYEELSMAIARLIENKILKKLNPRITTRREPPLALKYAIMKEDAEDFTLTKKEILKLNSVFNLDFYLSNPKIFRKDEEFIRIIDQYMNQKEKSLLSINELSYQLFNDEKFFKGKPDSRGEAILKNLGVRYEDLNCYYAYEPFIYHQFSRHNQEACVGLIIENKDTYWSFVRLLSHGATTLKINLLIYGEGKKIISSLRYLELLNLRTEEFLYFGDIDREGISIFQKLVEVYPSLDIQPFKSGYENLIRHTSHRSAQKTPKAQNYREQDIHNFCAHFEQPYSDRIKNIAIQGLYLPQEGLSLAGLLEEYGENRD